MEFGNLILGFLIWYSARWIDGANAVRIASPTELLILPDVTYEELEKMNGVCGFSRESCKARRYDQEEFKDMCNCLRHCANRRTCCIDSPYRNLKPNVEEPTCTNVFGQNWYDFNLIVEKCPEETRSDIKEKCEMRWKETDTDYLSVGSVTSLITNMTYKNYFCFRCNEEHDEYLFWNPIMFADIESDTKINNTYFVPVYNSSKKSWMAPLGQDGAPVNITLETVDPTNGAKSCRSQVISNCSRNWEDDVVRQKCNSYTLFTFFTRNGTYINYKNPHCALCNFEDLNKKECNEYTYGRGAGIGFSFSMLLDINGSDGHKVGQIKHCDDNFSWDPHFKKCRALKCALPGHVLKNGKCTAPD